MFCQKCGNQNAEGVKFCATCGAPLMDEPQAQPQPQYQQPQMPYQAPVIPGKGLGIASMVLGIISLVLFCVWYIAMPCAIVAAALGGVASSKAKAAGMKNGVATAGIVCSCIALGLALLFIILAAAGLASYGAFA